MKPMHAVVFAAALCAPLLAAPLTGPAAAQSAEEKKPTLTQKINAYVGCINRLSERSYESRNRYFSWVGKNGPTGKERIIYGTYTIYDTADCRANVEKANAIEPHDEKLEKAAAAYAQAVGALEPLLKEADDYYSAEDYKDDRMAKGKTLHPRLVTAWDAFAAADTALRAGIDDINDRMSADRLAEIEQSQGRRARYHIEALMMGAKRILRANKHERPNLAEITEALNDYERLLKSAEQLSPDAGEAKIGSSFISSAKSYLVSAKQLMRRIRDRVPYSAGDKMMINAGSGWMIEGSPARLSRDYNQLVDSYNRGG